MNAAVSKFEATESPLILCCPKPAGSALADEYFYYRFDGVNREVTHVARDMVPTVEAVGEGGEQYVFPRQNGWLVEINPLINPSKKWAVFSRDGRLYVDTFNHIYCLDEDELLVRARIFIFLARVVVDKKPSNLKQDRCIFWIRFPWLRTWFIDGDTQPEECDPFLDIFKELCSQEGRDKWRAKWSTGLAVRNESIQRA